MVADVCDEVVEHPDESDACIAWTMWRGSKRRRVADRHTLSGRPVICMENGWGAGNYQCVLRSWETTSSGVNGAGWYPPPTPHYERLNPNHQGDEILVCPQRGVTPNDPDISHGPEWTNTIVKRIREYSDRPILWKSRPDHPCVPDDTSDITIVDEIPSNPYCCVVYSSLIALDMIQRGTPVVADGEQVMYESVSNSLSDLENLNIYSESQRATCLQHARAQQVNKNNIKTHLEKLLENKIIA